jgi:CheY-like chemotaxis protein
MHDFPCALVVDDAQAARHRVAVLLQLAGWRVYEAVGMQAAVRAAAQLDPDLVVTAMRMRGGSGLALIQQLRGAGSRARLLVLTARPTSRVRRQAAVFGAGCLAKPLDPRQLVDFLRGRPATRPAPYYSRPVRVAAHRVHPESAGTARAGASQDVDGPSRIHGQRQLYLSALPRHLAWITESARAGDAAAVAEEASTLADESGRNGHPEVSRVCSTIAADARCGVLSQAKLMQLVLLASTSPAYR